MIYIIVLIFIVLAIIAKSPTIKGFIGEKSVLYQLSKLDKDKYLILNDIVIPTFNGKTTQIDHLVISEYGIFVIETKNYRGWIIGDESSQYWTQVIYKRKERLYNPIRQNYGHIKALEEVTKEFGSLPFFSIVCFSGRAELKVNSISKVIYTENLIRTIGNYRDKRIDKDEVERVSKAILSVGLKNKDAKKAHVKALKSNIEDKINKISHNECPKCGQQLVVRRGRYGDFRGCSGYPKCKFVVK
jgi:hypothetical protein